MNSEREKEIRDMVRGEILYHIEEDLYQEGEHLMKNVWEQLNGPEYKIADEEMLKIIHAIETLPY